MSPIHPRLCTPGHVQRRRARLVLVNVHRLGDLVTAAVRTNGCRQHRHPLGSRIIEQAGLYWLRNQTVDRASGLELTQSTRLCAYISCPRLNMIVEISTIVASTIYGEIMTGDNSWC